MERDSEVRSVEENVRRVVKNKIIEEKLFGDFNHNSSDRFKSFQASSHIVDAVEMWQERLKTFYSFSSFKVLEDYS